MCEDGADTGTLLYVFRYQVKYVTRTVSLGNIRFISLKQAKLKSLEYRSLLLTGKDPLTAKAEERNKLFDQIQEFKINKHAKNSVLTFAEVAVRYLEYRKESGSFKKNPRAENAYYGMLINHAYPVIKNKAIARITPYDIRDILAKVWSTQPSLSKKLSPFLKNIFDWAKAMKYLENKDNPADMAGPLKTLMEPFNYGRAEEGHFSSLDFRLLPDFIKELWERGTTGALALMFSILTTARSKPVRRLKWEQLDLENKTWDIPLDNDKSKKVNRLRTIILSDQAVYLLHKIVKRDDVWVFPSASHNAPLSDAVFSKLIKDLNALRAQQKRPLLIDPNVLDSKGQPKLITQHGTARATFKTWAKSDELGNNRRFFDEAVELCLLHERKDPLKGAYDRSRLENERRIVINEWGKFCCSQIKEFR